jgi:hypothetical protein
MKTKRFFLFGLPVMLLALGLVLAASLALAGCGGEDDEDDDAIKISTAAQFNAIRNNLSGHYVLTTDIDLSPYANWLPIGTVDLGAMMTGDEEKAFSTGFSGQFDGNGHTISNINCSAEYSMGVGLFGLISGGGTVKNLKVVNANVSGGGGVGAVVGVNVLGIIDGVILAGENSVTTTVMSGGICGGNQYGTIVNCEVKNCTVNVTGDNDFSSGRIIQYDNAECGGLIVGGGFGGTVDNCTANGSVIALGNEPVGLGGIGGCLQQMESISGNTVTVTIEAGNGHAIGGLCGYAGNGDDGSHNIGDPCVIKDNTVNVTINSSGATHVGGLVGTGLYYFGMEGRFIIEDCSVSGAINGAVTPGTVAGRAEGSTIVSGTVDVTVDGNPGTTQIGTTTQMYESADQY